MTDETTWRKSTRSGSTSNCIELAGTLGALRDSKNPTGPVLAGEVTELLDAVKTDRIG